MKILEPIPDQWSHLAEIDRMGMELLEGILERETPPSIGEDAPSFEDKVLDVIPSAITKGCHTGTTAAIRRAQLEIPTDGLPTCLVAALKRLATLANPVFFQKQKLRFGTYDTPRFIFCGEIHPGRIVLPRGVVKEAKSLFRKAGGKLKIEDKRTPADIRSFAFHGKLNTAQETAVAAMLEHDEGVLLATSSLIGEGFDLPQLDTLFLTLPISFKGRLIQYAGRLDRSWKGKTEVRIYDYMEPGNRLTAHMFRKRASAYRTMGYEAED